MSAAVSTAQAAIATVPRGVYVGGVWREASGGRTLAVENPATGTTLAEVADGTVEDARACLDAACEAAGPWAETSPNERSEILSRAYEGLREREDEFAMVMTLEMGKPLAEARAELAYAADFFRWNAGEALRLEGGFKIAGDGRSRVVTMRQPVGPCLLITPWNFPLAMGTRKIGPAIAAGCTMVIKPASSTPLTTFLLADLLARCGLPAGVLNVIATTRSGATMSALLADSRLRKLSFTGSTEVGRRLIAGSAEGVLKVSMELGGNAPFIVFDDADLEAAVDGAMLAKMRNGGEACTAANRFYVAEGVAAEFSGRLAERVSSLSVGNGTEGAEVGPLIDADQVQKVSELVRDAESRGARVLTGGQPIDGAGHFFEPTVIAGVPPGSRMLDEEIFGPVAPILTFADEDEVVAAANDTEHGLVAYVFTRELERALRVCERLDVGMVGLNQGIVSNAGAPFGGVKASGLGREGGGQGIDEYLETKYLAVPRG